MNNKMLFTAVSIALAAFAAQASDINNSEGTIRYKGFDLTAGSQRNTDVLPAENKAEDVVAPAIDIEKPVVEKSAKGEFDKPEGAKQHRR